MQSFIHSQLLFPKDINSFADPMYIYRIDLDRLNVSRILFFEQRRPNVVFNHDMHTWSQNKLKAFLFFRRTVWRKKTAKKLKTNLENSLNIKSLMKRTPNLKQMRAMEKGNNSLHKVTVNNQCKRETLE